jgi:hypothetical protein
MGDGETTKARFEPPPWEREAFEALAARRAEEEAAAAALQAAESASVASTGEAGRQLDPPPAVTAAAATAPVAAGSPAADDHAFAAMLVQLQVEERTDGRVAQRIGQGAALFTGALGLGMLIAGLMMMRSGSGQSIAVIGSAVLSIFGLSFIGMASWVWITASRSKGR